MNKFFKNLLRELRSTYDEFFDFENARLHEELDKRKFEIKCKNYADVMRNRIIPFVRDKELADTGILLTNDQLFERAHNIFCKAKQDGKFDELNRLIEA